MHVLSSPKKASKALSASFTNTLLFSSLNIEARVPAIPCPFLLTTVCCSISFCHPTLNNSILPTTIAITKMLFGSSNSTGAKTLKLIKEWIIK